MFNEYIYELENYEVNEKRKEIQLIKNIIKTRKELKEVNKNFEFAQDELVDYYIYSIKANQAKLNYLIRKAKTCGINVDMINDIKYRLMDDEEVV